MHPLFTHPVVLFVWTAGYCTALLFAWLTLSNVLSTRALGGDPRNAYTRFTGLSCVHALSVGFSLLPTSLPVKLAIFQLMWVLGTAALASWVHALCEFCRLESRLLVWLARGLLLVSCGALLDLVLTPLLGHSMMFVPQDAVPPSFVLQAAGMSATGSFYAQALGGFGVLLIFSVCATLAVALVRSGTRDPFLYIGVAVTGICTATEIGLSAANSAYNMPLVFMANLVAGLRMTWVNQRASTAELERIRQAKNQQAAIIEQQLDDLKAISRLAEVGENTARLTHDMRNPLTVALGSLDLLEAELAEGEPDLDESKRMLALARLSIDHVSGLATKVTSQARPHASEAVTEVSLVSVIDDAWSLNPASSVRITNRVDPELRVLGRPTELTQVFLNLLANATRAQDKTDDPWIVVEGEPRERMVRIRVSDGGQRPSSDTVDRMFRTQFTTAPESQGTGLGLTICKHIVGEHDGSIWVDRESPNTSIVVELPRAVPAPPLH